jgi:hypothetical protein
MWSQFHFPTERQKEKLSDRNRDMTVSIFHAKSNVKQTSLVPYEQSVGTPRPWAFCHMEPTRKSHTGLLGAAAILMDQ